MNQNNSPINVDLYQCDTNNTIFNNTIINNDRIFNNLMHPCNISCCISNNLNKTIVLNTCQITVRSSTNICVGRFCYSGKCDTFSFLANMIHDDKIENKTTIMDTIHASSGYIPWSSIINSTRTKWTSWIDETSIRIRPIILIILFIISISLTFMTLIVVIKSMRHANIISNRKSYRYTLL
ncbi:unnamed protein product [Adineta steineri]|uniref:Uncharacterized protein n=1 Tax=Adineta steineri TaxID=433720 RepID=A0A815EYC2_9BILA|nr:unnamed protein product [Adineta steineri]CAF1317737.1 unnamed protein product [Adineta steineri]